MIMGESAANHFGNDFTPMCFAPFLQIPFGVSLLPSIDPKEDAMSEQRSEYIRKLQKHWEKQLDGKPIPDDDKLQEWALLEIAAQLDELKQLLAQTRALRKAA
jgi:hypothetical protein